MTIVGDLDQQGIGARHLLSTRFQPSYQLRRLSNRAPFEQLGSEKSSVNIAIIA